MLARTDTRSPPTAADGNPIVSFQLAWLNGLGRHTQSAGGLTAKIPPGSPHTKDSILKIPAFVDADGYTRGLREWTKRPLQTMEEGKACQRTGANTSLRLGKLQGTDLAFGALDIDSEDPVVVREVTARAYEHLGLSERRVRPGSPRVLMLYRPVRGAELLPKIRVPFTSKNGAKEAIEILLRGTHCIIWGHHKAGPYSWPDGFPEADELPEIDPGAINRFLGAKP